MLKRRVVLQAASVLMGAMVAGSSVPVIAVYAENASGDVQAETTAEVQAEEETGIALEETVAILYGGTAEPMLIDKETALEAFVKQIMEMAEIEADENFRLDWVDANGMRTRLLPVADPDTENDDSDTIESGSNIDSDLDADMTEADSDIVIVPVPTVSDLYALAQEQEEGFKLVVFDDDQEIIRLNVMKADEEDALVIDVAETDADNMYLISFDANGGTLDNERNMLRTGGDAISYIENSAAYENHTFAGWYDASDGGNEVTEATIVEADMTLYAHWERDDSDNTDATDDNDDMADTSDSVDRDSTADSTDNVDDSTTDDANSTNDDEMTNTDSIDITDNNDTSDNSSGTDIANGTDKTSGTDKTDDKNNTGTTDSVSEKVATYTLSVISLTGTENSVTVKSNVTVAALADKLAEKGIMSEKAASFHLKTSSVTEHAIDGTTTMKTIAELAESGDVLIIGYDSDGKALGSAKVTKTDENKYQVVLSQDTNVALDSSSEKGKGEGETTNTVTQTGKSDSVVGSIQTDDTDVLPVYGGMSGLMAALFGVVGFLRKKKI